MIASTLVLPTIVTSTLATIIFIGLGFLPRPSRATAIWSAAFAVAMIGAYVWLAQDFVLPAQMRAIGSGLALAPMGLLYSGLRAYRDQRRQFVPLSLAFVVIAPAALLIATELGVYGIAFRSAFCVTSVIAVLTFLELVRLGPQLRDEAIPLLGVSAAFVVFGGITFINGLLVANGDATPAEGLQFLRTINLIGMVVYVVCALVTTLLLTVRSDSMSTAPNRDFDRIARNRLDRARAAGDQWWSLLDIRLDDPDEIRLATSTAAFNAACQKFARDIDSVMPADSDIEPINPTCFVVLLPRPQGGVRDLVTELLERLSGSDDAQPLPIRLSASIGWAPVSVVGHGYDDLVRAASQAAQDAHATGGDRWVRVHGEGAHDGRD